jgi:Icc-related predicted phosphoesterase
MNLIVLTDLHGRTTGPEHLDADLKDADLIILCGDITHFGSGVEAERIIGLINRYRNQILAVSGNCDLSEVNNKLRALEIDLEGSIRSVGGISFTGLNGSLPCPVRTPNERTETEFQLLLDNLNNPPYNYSSEWIFVTHQPPYGTICDRLPDGRHVGSRVIRKYLEQTQPLICFTGHIHEGVGVDRIGRTTVVNPGPFRGGNYARVKLGFSSTPEVELIT